MSLLANNLTGIAVITDPNQIPNQMPSNFIDPYDYAMVYQPELIPELVYANGKGSILGFMRATKSGMNRTFSSDQIQHAEAGRLHRSMKNVTIAGNNFTFPSPHGLQPKMVVRFSHEGTQYQGIVASITSPTVAVILNDDTTTFPTGTPVDVTIDFSSRFLKGDEPFKQGTKHDVRIYKNYAHIFKWRQDTTNSDMGHNVWVKTDKGPQWFNFEMARESAKFDNVTELTAVFHRRAKDNAPSTLAGNPQGMYGVAEIVENYGNVFNDLIENVQDLSDIAFRLKQQGVVRELNMWCNHRQMAKFRELCAGVNASFLQGFHYGSFQNSADMALKLDFVSIKVDGVQFNFTSWACLDDPTLQGIVGGVDGINFLGVPTGNEKVTIDGDVCSVPRLEMLFRKTTTGVREKETKFFGKLGTPVEQDASWVDWLSEGTVRVSAPNNYFIGGTYNIGSVSI